MSKENKLKAAYLMNFTKFIEWPKTARPGEPQALYICLQEATPFEAFLRKLIVSNHATPKKRKLHVVSGGSEHACNIIYNHRKMNTLSAAAKTSVTVAASQAVASSQTAITFYVDRRKLRFEVDMSSLQALNVTVSSELLKLARIK